MLKTIEGEKKNSEEEGGSEGGEVGRQTRREEPATVRSQ